MNAPSWPLWGGHRIYFWTDARGWAVDLAGPGADWFDLLAVGLPSIEAAQGVARQFLLQHGFHRVHADEDDL